MHSMNFNHLFSSPFISFTQFLPPTFANYV